MNRVLDNIQIHLILRRIAWELIEKCTGKGKTVLLGIGKNGGHLASILHNEIRLSKLMDVMLIHTKKGLDKGLNLEKAEDSSILEQADSIIIVDDVLFSGMTMFHALELAIGYQPSMVISVALIDRGHRKISIHPDHFGLKLATTRLQHVDVVINDQQELEAFLL